MIVNLASYRLTPDRVNLAAPTRTASVAGVLGEDVITGTVKVGLASLIIDLRKILPLEPQTSFKPYYLEG